MAEIIVSLSSDRDNREIDEYHDDSNSSGSSSESSSSDERYSFGTLEISLEVFQEEVRKRVASGLSARPSTAPPSSTPPSSNQVDDVLECCAMNIPSKI